MKQTTGLKMLAFLMLTLFLTINASIEERRVYRVDAEHGGPEDQDAELDRHHEHVPEIEPDQWPVPHHDDAFVPFHGDAFDGPPNNEVIVDPEGYPVDPGFDAGFNPSPGGYPVDPGFDAGFNPSLGGYPVDPGFDAGYNPSYPGDLVDPGFNPSLRGDRDGPPSHVDGPSDGPPTHVDEPSDGPPSHVDGPSDTPPSDDTPAESGEKTAYDKAYNPDIIAVLGRSAGSSAVDDPSAVHSVSSDPEDEELKKYWRDLFAFEDDHAVDHAVDHEVQKRDTEHVEREEGLVRSARAVGPEWTWPDDLHKKSIFLPHPDFVPLSRFPPPRFPPSRRPRPKAKFSREY